MSALDPARWCIIVVNQIGNGISSSPHNTAGAQAMAKFPRINIGDDVRAQHKLVTEVFGIERLALVFGGSMGAQQTYDWAVRYPDMVARAAPLAGYARNTDHDKLFVETLMEAIPSDPGFNGGQPLQVGGLDLPHLPVQPAQHRAAVDADLMKFQGLYDESADLARMVRSPVISADDQGKAVATILSKVGASDLTINFFKLLAKNRRLFLEHYEIIKKAWTNDTFSHKSEHWTIPPEGLNFNHEVVNRFGKGQNADGIITEIGIAPKTFQKPHPPIFQPFSFSEDTFRFCAREGIAPFALATDDDVLSELFAGNAAYLSRLDAIDAEVEQEVAAAVETARSGAHPQFAAAAADVYTQSA